MSKSTTASKTEENAAADDAAVPAATVKILTLDERVARALTHPEQFTSFEKLIAEVNEQLDHTDQRARAARARAIDASVQDPAARGAAEDAEFEAARLKDGLAKLKDLEAAAREREQVERLSAERARVIAIRDKLADDLKTIYVPAAQQLAALFAAIEKCDQECKRAGIPSVELAARQIPNFMSNDVRLAEQMRLPTLVVGRHGSAEVWPPKKLPMSLQLTGAPAF
jgi:hypothetical protein